MVWEKQIKMLSYYKKIIRWAYNGVLFRLINESDLLIFKEQILIDMNQLKSKDTTITFTQN